MADIKLKNTANTEFSISHNGTRGAKSVTSDQIVVAVETINDFPASPETGDTVIVKDQSRGGTFIYDATKSAVNNSGTIFDGCVRQYAGAVNVKWFGVVGDGVTDDTVAMINAFKYASHIEGSPELDIIISHTVFYYTDTIFNGNGCKITHQSNTVNGSAFMPSTFQSDTLWTTNVIFKNFTLNSWDSGGNGIAGARAKHITLFNVSSEYLYWHVFDGAYSRNILIDSCVISSNRTAAFQADNATYANASEASDAQGNILGIAFVTDGSSSSNCRDMTVTNCTISNCGIAGVHLHNKNNQNIIITNNRFESNTRAIYSDDGLLINQIGLIIADNIFINNNLALYLLSAHSDVLISGNRFYSEKYNSDYYQLIYIRSLSTTLAKENISIVGNIINGAVRAISIDGYNNINITGNQLLSCGNNYPTSLSDVAKLLPQATIELTGARNFTVSNNCFSSCRNPAAISIQQGVTYVTSSVFGTISGNTFSSGGSAVSMSNTSKVVISGNNYAAGTTPDFVGFYQGASSYENLFTDNVISQTGGHGIYIYGGGISAINNNVFRSSGTTGNIIRIEGSNLVNTSNNRYYSGYSSDIINILTSTNVDLSEAYTSFTKDIASTGQKVTFSKTSI